MFGIFKKKKSEEVTVFNPTEGKVIPIEEVNDGVFSEKMLGDGFAVIPNNDHNVYAPVAGRITNIFPSKHAFGIQTDDGLEVLIHIGLDTVELNGEPFELMVEEGASISKDTLLVKVDWELIKARGKGIPIIIVFTNMDTVKKIEINNGSNVLANHTIGKVSLV